MFIWLQFKGGMWNRYLKLTKDNFGRKIKPTGYIYLDGSRYCEAKGHLKLRLSLQGAIINSASNIVKYTKELELYNQRPPRKVKDSNMSEIKIR